jgi:putative membrane protein
MNDRVARHVTARLPIVLLVLFALWWLALAIAPVYRQDWLLENVLVFVAVPLLLFGYRRLRFSNVAYACLFVFFMLHEIGAHYTYAEVPYDRWVMSLTGHSLNDALGLARNHYDRLVHFLYGVLITPAVLELLDTRAPQQGLWRWLVPWFFMAGHGVVFEMVEATAAGVFGGDLGQAYLGTQGDVWDAQKDSALAALGAAITIVVLRWRRRA